MKLSQIKREQTAVVKFGEEKVTVTFNPNKITPAMMNLTQGMAWGDSLVYQITESVVGWDLTDDNDQPIAINAESVASIPSYILDGILKRVAQEMMAPSADEKKG